MNTLCLTNLTLKVIPTPRVLRQQPKILLNEDVYILDSVYLFTIVARPPNRDCSPLLIALTRGELEEASQTWEAVRQSPNLASVTFSSFACIRAQVS